MSPFCMCVCTRRTVLQNSCLVNAAVIGLVTCPSSLRRGAGVSGRGMQEGEYSSGEYSGAGEYSSKEYSSSDYKRDEYETEDYGYDS